MTARRSFDQTPASRISTSNDEWAAYCPEHADEPFGDVMNSMKKYVIYNGLQAAEWQNSELISGDLARRLADIKAQDGGDIAMSGSATTVRWLLREGSLDELTCSCIRSQSATAWRGSFRRTSRASPLELLRAETFKSGGLNLSYGPIKG